MSGLRDVVIYEKSTSKIDTIAGESLTWTGPRNSVEIRLATVLSRLNRHYDACTVPAGKYKKGDVIQPSDLCEDWSETKKVVAEQSE